MAKYLKNVLSYEDLKNKYRELLKANHPDNGGDLEVMQEINCEYDALFKIWKDRAIKENTIKEEEKQETAQSTKRHFYSAYGWEGSRYDSKLSLKEISKIVKNYTKEKYPTCKFSVRTHYASMCQSLSVDLLEFPSQMYKTAEELENDGLTITKTYTDRNGETQTFEDYKEEIHTLLHKLHYNGFLPDSYYTKDIFAAYEKACKENQSFYGVKTEYFESVINDIDSFVASYNYDDSDSQTDYFDVNFYDGKCDYSHCQFVPNVARVAKKDYAPSAPKKATEESTTVAIETSGENFSIEESEHTKTHEKIYLVKCLQTLSRDNYILLNNLFKENGGYYSKFTHSFIFKDDPSEFLKGVRIA